MDRLSTTGGTSPHAFTYDAMGNLSFDGKYTNTYLNNGRLNTVTWVTGTAPNTTTNTATYNINALGQRVRKVAPSNVGGTRRFMYDEAGRLAGEYDASGKLVQETIWLGDLPIATLRPKSGSTTTPIAIDTFYVHSDHLGTPRVITRPSDNKIVWKWDATEAFGNSLPNENPSALGAFKYNLRMPGQYFDLETGLSQNYFRDYDSSLGRYVQSDPIGLAAGLSTYGYVFANPLSWTDPYGLDVKVCFYADAAAGFGHIGFGLSGESRTRGFYPKGNGFDSPGAVKIDSQDGMQCKTVSTDPKQEDCMAKCRKRREDDPGRYQLTSRQCTSYVRDCLSECGLLTSSYTGPKPRPLYQDLVAK